MPISLALLKLAHCPGVDAHKREGCDSERGHGAAKMIGLLFRPALRDQPAALLLLHRQDGEIIRDAALHRGGALRAPLRRSRPCGPSPDLCRRRWRP